MDKQINKIKKNVGKQSMLIKKEKKDIGTLLKMDKKQDSKLKKAGFKPE